MKVVTAAEQEKMTPAERKHLFDESIVTDLSTASPRVQALVDRARLRRQARTSAGDTQSA